MGLAASSTVGEDFEELLGSVMGVSRAMRLS